MCIIAQHGIQYCKNKYIKTNKKQLSDVEGDECGTLHMYIWVSHAIQRPASNNLPVLAVALEAVTKNKGIKLITRGGW